MREVCKMVDLDEEIMNSFPKEYDQKKVMNELVRLPSGTDGQQMKIVILTSLLDAGSASATSV